MVKSSKQTKQKQDQPHTNYLLLGLFCLLIVWGILTVSTISFPFSLEDQCSPWYYLLNQFMRLFIGIGAAVFFFKLPLEKLKKIAPVLFFINIGLLLVVFLPKIGIAGGGAQRWISLGWFSFQPSEFLKLFFIVYIASWLANREPLLKQKKVVKVFLPFLAILAGLTAILILQPDLSTLTIICLVGGVMYFAASSAWWQTPALAGIFITSCLIFIKTAPYRLARLTIFLNPEKDPLGLGYQLRQSLIALGSGRLWGAGGAPSFGLSRQKFGFVPEPMTDSIFAIIGEELGFVGAVFLILCFLLLAFLGLRLALKTDTIFNKLLVLGITFWLCFQAFFNIGGIIGILPLGGVPLPFFSYGGSHLITELAAVGILLNISKHSQ